MIDQDFQFPTQIPKYRVIAKEVQPPEWKRERSMPALRQKRQYSPGEECVTLRGAFHEQRPEPGIGERYWSIRLDKEFVVCSPKVRIREKIICPV